MLLFLDEKGNEIYIIIILQTLLFTKGIEIYIKVIYMCALHYQYAL